MAAQRFDAAALRRRAVVLVVAAAIAGPQLEADELGSALASAVRRARADARDMAVQVVDAETGREVYSFRADEPLIAASNVKLLTTALALEELGPGFHFETPMLVKGRIRGATLHGALAVIGSGDPNLSGRFFDGDPLAVFSGLAKSLQALGIESFRGELFLVHGLFDEELVHPDWPRDQLTRWYEAPVEALSFSDNCVLVRVTAARRVGQPATVQVIPDVGSFRVEGSIATTGSRRLHHVVVDRDEGTSTIRVSGAMLRGSAPIETWVTVADPVDYFGRALVRGLELHGIEVAARLRKVRSLPAGPWLAAASLRSDVLTTLEVTNRRSQNFYAESLLKVLAARLCGDGSWAAGRRLLMAFLDRLGVEGRYTLADGSGMSRRNRLAPRQLAAVLSYMYRHELQEEFMLTLPFSGLEDHRRWRTRLAEEPYRGNVIAKTGTLRGVSTISGYARAVSGRVYVFSILCNSLRSVWDGRRAQDRIVRALIDSG